MTSKPSDARPPNTYAYKRIQDKIPELRGLGLYDALDVMQEHFDDKLAEAENLLAQLEARHGHHGRHGHDAERVSSEA